MHISPNALVLIAEAVAGVGILGALVTAAPVFAGRLRKQQPKSTSAQAQAQDVIRVDLELDNMRPMGLRAIAHNLSADIDADEVNLDICLKKAGTLDPYTEFHHYCWSRIIRGERAVSSAPQSLSDFMLSRKVLEAVWEPSASYPSQRYKLLDSCSWDVLVKVEYQVGDALNVQHGRQAKLYHLIPRSAPIKPQRYPSVSEYNEFSHWELEFVELK